MKRTDNEYCGFATINNFDNEKTIKRMKKYPQVDISVLKKYFNNDLIEEFVGTWEYIQIINQQYKY